MLEPEYQPRDRVFWPSRALYAEYGDCRATATWQLKGRQWVCCSASKWLRWMRGMKDFTAVKELLNKHGYRWHWLPSVMKTAPKPPF